MIEVFLKNEGLTIGSNEVGKISDFWRKGLFFKSKMKIFNKAILDNLEVEIDRSFIEVDNLKPGWHSVAVEGPDSELRFNFYGTGVKIEGIAYVPQNDMSDILYKGAR